MEKCRKRHFSVNVMEEETFADRNCFSLLYSAV